MPFVQAKCPECGGMLAVDNTEKAAICQFCGKAFIVQEAINNYNTYNTYNNDNRVTNNYGDGAVVNVYENPNKDFVIEAGVLKEYHGASTDVVIPDGVEEIAFDCFNRSRIRSVVIPNSVTCINSRAFEYCTNLVSVNIPNGVTEISYNLFSGCKNLKTVNIPDGVTNIYDCAFSWCESLESITIPNSVTYIGPGAFVRCSSLTSIVIPDSVTSIGEGAFRACTNLKLVKIPSNKKISWGRDVFTETAYFAEFNRKMEEEAAKQAAIWEVERKRQKAIIEAERQRTVEMWKQQGLCEYCGGKFRGLIAVRGSVCSKCGKRKKY